MRQHSCACKRRSPAAAASSAAAAKCCSASATWPSKTSADASTRPAIACSRGGKAMLCHRGRARLTAAWNGPVKRSTAQQFSSAAAASAGSAVVARVQAAMTFSLSMQRSAVTCPSASAAKWRQWRRSAASDLSARLAARRSAAYSCTVRSMPKRPSLSRSTSDFSTRDCKTSATHRPATSSKSSTTASADSRAKPPSKVESWASADCSACDSRSQDQSSVARSVAWRSRRPPRAASNLKRSPMRRSRMFGGSTRTRAAASSMARGSRSSKSTRGAIAAASVALKALVTPAARTRCWNICTASAVSSGVSSKACSPAMPSTSRLVTMKRACGARSSHAPTVSSACRATCSKLSSTMRQAPRPAMAVASWRTGSALPSGTSSPCATACTMPSTLRADARSQNHAPPG